MGENNELKNRYLLVNSPEEWQNGTTTEQVGRIYPYWKYRYCEIARYNRCSTNNRKVDDGDHRAEAKTHFLRELS